MDELIIAHSIGSATRTNTYQPDFDAETTFMYAAALRERILERPETMLTVIP